MDRVSGHTFFPRFLRRGSVVVDLGADVGGFSRLIARRYGCVCYAVEPDPAHFARLDESVRVKPFNLAIAGREGTRRFTVGARTPAARTIQASSLTPNNESMQTPEDESLQGDDVWVPAMRLDDFARRNGLTQIDLLKVNVDGEEAALLDSLPDAFFAGVGQITVEFNDFSGLVHKDEISRAVQRFEALGFRSINFTKCSRGHDDHLFVNLRLCPVGPVEFALTKYVTKNVMGVARIVARGWRMFFRSGAIVA